MKIALDAMGGDHAPQAPIKGAIKALKITPDGLNITLVGKESSILRELNGFSSKKLSILNASEKITINDSASKIIKTKPDSSMVRGIGLLKEKHVDALCC